MSGEFSAILTHEQGAQMFSKNFKQGVLRRVQQLEQDVLDTSSKIKDLNVRILGDVVNRGELEQWFELYYKRDLDFAKSLLSLEEADLMLEFLKLSDLPEVHTICPYHDEKQGYYALAIWTDEVSNVMRMSRKAQDADAYLLCWNYGAREIFVADHTGTRATTEQRRNLRPFLPDGPDVPRGETYVDLLEQGKICDAFANVLDQLSLGPVAT